MLACWCSRPRSALLDAALTEMMVPFVLRDQYLFEQSSHQTPMLSLAAAMTFAFSRQLKGCRVLGLCRQSVRSLTVFFCFLFASASLSSTVLDHRCFTAKCKSAPSTKSATRLYLAALQFLPCFHRATLHLLEVHESSHRDEATYTKRQSEGESTDHEAYAYSQPTQ